ncbi:S-adenosyl-l-methionine hydroxide adenosyltransferase family protein [Kovacikia minuta CCNUW1]|uniref:SAM hydrolase/SAM-dependent halogenase family protein n=1 Tax=Kovacikia minuta TaxID=2931930 RepID=UPI001CC9AB08|nr:SAM-dependent chlorinase/fluorinase [Kovacikia minuta]UBF24637.1 S-adenosyl-l-methionine hydroxide adenosyltransferase family protein [Kovacikia minuta CCNUW1]
MSQRRILTLLSDFGLSDVYVGVMKGVIFAVNADLSLVDLTHQIPPQNIAVARFALMTAFPYFAEGTVHVAVVDPGVGGTRRAIALAVGADSANPAGFLVGPDNGLLSGVFCHYPVISAVELTNQRYWRTPEPSRTFHGRDIFATVGAHLASGVPLHALGQAIAPETLIQLELPALQVEAFDAITTRITGCIQASDHFGNLMTNIPASQVLNRNWVVVTNGITIPASQTYSDRPSGELTALIGSHGWVEVAINGGSARAKLNLEWGDQIQVFIAGDR